jgi:hypothetical protein
MTWTSIGTRKAITHVCDYLLEQIT